MKYHQLAAQFPAGVPIQSAFITPGALRKEVRIADVGGVVIVQVGVAGNSKSTAHASAQFEVLRKPHASADAGTEHSRDRPVNLLARSNREREPAQYVHIERCVAGRAASG